MKSIFKLSIVSFLFGFNSFQIYSQSLKDTLKIDEVVVTGTRIQIARNNMPVNVTIIKNEDLDEIEESAVLPVLSRKVPGLFVTERGITGFGVGSSMAGQVSIRGVGASPNTQVLMLIDGHPQYMGIFGHPLPNSYVASDFERIEIIKGPASILYGSNAMGGVINFITKRQEKDGISGEARLAYGSYNTQKYMANAGFRKKGFNLMFSYNHDQTDGHRDSSAFTIDNAYLKTGYDLSKHFTISADFNIAKFNSEDPGIITHPALFKADIERGKTSVFIRNAFEKTEGGILGFYNFGKHSLSDGWESTDSNYGLSLFQSLKYIKNNLISLGFDAKNVGGKGNSGMARDVWKSVTEIAGYVFTQQRLDKLTLSAGMRLENNSSYGNELVPQLGAAYNFTEKTSLKASLAKGFRSPTVMEIFIFMPNPDLKPERTLNYELSLNKLLLDNKISAEITVFMIDGSNLIKLVTNDTPPPPNKRVNIGEFSNKGLELAVNYQINESLKTDMSYSFLKMDTPIVAAPENQFYLGLNYKFNKFTFSLQSNYIGGLYVNVGDDSGSNPDVLEEYLLINAGIKYRPVKSIEIFISGKNLTDTKYQIDNGYPMPGINLMTGVGVKF